MANKVRIKSEIMEASNDESADQVLDLRKSNGGIRMCTWCAKKKVLPESGFGDEFCSEICFEQYRRDSFKKRSACFWCSNNNGQGLLNINLANNFDETKFCSDYCLAQFKVRLFCEETSSHLEQINKDFTMQTNGIGNPGTLPIPPFNSNNKDLITPELWLRKSTTPVFLSNPTTPMNNGKMNPATGMSSFQTSAVMDSLFVGNNSMLSPRTFCGGRQGDQLSPSSSATSSRRASSPGSNNSIHSLSPMPSPAVGPSRKRQRATLSTGNQSKRTPRQNPRNNVKDPPKQSARGRKQQPPPPPALMLGNQINPMTNKNSYPKSNDFMMSVAQAQMKMAEFEDKFSSIPTPSSGQGQESSLGAGVGLTPDNIPTNHAPGNTRNNNGVSVNESLQTAQKLSSILPKILVMIPYPIPFPIPFPVRLEDFYGGGSGAGANNGNAGVGRNVFRVLNQLDETD